ncbi:MAG: hypothetical protein LBC99_06370 [Spirochaetota bacterium]|jgi:hypothetical protein|nr:hypothetical protein [Spirochaetota bacterium]
MNREPCAFCQTINDEERIFCEGCGVALPNLGGGVPWEQRRSLGFISALLETVFTLFRQPSVFFARVGGEARHGGALLFAAAIGFFATLVATLWTLFLSGEEIRSFVALILEKFGHLENSAELSETTFKYIMAAEVICAPLISVIEIYCLSGLIWLAMKALSVPGRKFSLVLLLIAFTRVSQLALVLPEIGGLISSILAVVFTTIALGTRFRLTWGKAVFLAIAPSLAGVFLILAGTLAMGLMG